MTRSDIWEECTVQLFWEREELGEEFGRNNVLGTLKFLGYVWPIKAAEICVIHLKQVPSSRKKRRFTYKKIKIRRYNTFQ